MTSMPINPSPVVRPSCYSNPSNLTPAAAVDITNSSTFRYFACVWGKKSARKHKKWEGDGLLRVATTTALLIDEEGKELGRGSGYKAAQLEELEDGGRLGVGSKEVEVTGDATEQDWQRLTAMARKEVHARKEERLKEKAVKTMEPVAAQSSDNPTTSSGTIMATSSPINFKPFRVPTRVGTTLPQFTAARVVAPGQEPLSCLAPLLDIHSGVRPAWCRWWLTLTLASSCDHIKGQGFFFCTVVS